MLDPLGLGFQAVVSRHVGAGDKPGSCGKATGALNGRAISTVRSACLLKGLSSDSATGWLLGL